MITLNLQKNGLDEALAKLGAYYAMPATGGYGNSGVPDFLVCYKGTFVGIEVKANGNKPTALQMHNLVKIREAGGYGFVIDETNVSELMQSMESIK